MSDELRIGSASDDDVFGRSPAPFTPTAEELAAYEQVRANLEAALQSKQIAYYELGPLEARVGDVPICRAVIHPIQALNNIECHLVI